MKLTLAQARRFLSALHFDDSDTKRLSRVDRVIHHVRQRGCIQYDPINIVGRNPDLVLQSRIHGYLPAHLHEALYRRRALVDGFDKNLSIYPTEDYPYFARIRREMAGEFSRNATVFDSFDAVLTQIDARGPLCSDDIPLSEKVEWPWGMTRLSRAALESLWMRGDLALHHRKGARRYYDLASRCLPAEILAQNDPNTAIEEYQAWRLARRIGGVGLLWNAASDAFLCIEDFKANERGRAFAHLMKRGEVTEMQVEGLSRPLFLLTRDLPVLDRALAGMPDSEMRILAPLDNLLWDRRLVSALYDFDYRWEIYTPAARRKYGYYVLPVLYRDKLVARFEPENFSGGTLHIRHWWWEPGFRAGVQAKKAREKCLLRFCKFLNAEGYRIQEEL